MARTGSLWLLHVVRRDNLSNMLEFVETAVLQADEFTKATAGSKLTVIADQICYLQEQARKALEEAKRDTMLHHAACNMVKKSGKVYNLYERESGQKFFSILSPKEWGPSCPYEFVGAFKLEHDMSWTP